MRVGFNILELQRVRWRLGASATAAINAVLEGVSRHYAERIAKRSAIEPPDGLRAQIDEALDVATMEAAQRGHQAVDALVGLRRAFFPQAPAPESGHARYMPTAIAAE